MKNFEFAQPRTEQEALQLLNAQPGHTELLAGGTDLLGLMKKMIMLHFLSEDIKQRLVSDTS